MKCLLICIIATIYLSCNANNKMEIVPMEPVNRDYVDSSKTPPRRNKINNYLVKNYNGKNNVVELDRFAFSHVDSSMLKPGNDFRIIFYKESDKTNIPSIEKDINVVEDYSHWHDLIYSYTWFEGKFSREKIVDGMPVKDEKGSVILEEIRDNQ